MKRGAPDHWKMKALARELKIPPAHAVGLMEMLWHYTAKHHPQGDIGTAPDWAIAEASGWTVRKRVDRSGLDAAKVRQFIDALVVVGWLDRDARVTGADGTLPVVYRLVVHEWYTHADEGVRKTLKNKGLSFIIPTVTAPLDGLPEPLPLPLPLPLPYAGRKFLPAANANPTTTEDLREITDGYDRHLKHSGKESEQAVIQIVLSMNGQFDWVKFRLNHAGYCAHYAAHGWDYCTVSFLGWIRAGMPPAPPPKGQAKPAEKPYGCPVCRVEPCECFARQIAKEEARAKNSAGRPV